MEHFYCHFVKYNERHHMKRHISSLVFGTLGAAAGFALCFVYFVLPRADALQRGQEAQQAMTVFSKLSIHYGERGQYFTLPGMIRHE